MIQFAQVDRAVIERAALEYAVNALWQLPLLAGAAWLAIRLLAPPPRTQHRLWVAVLLLAVVMPSHGVHWPASTDSAVPAPPPVPVQPRTPILAPEDASALVSAETPPPDEGVLPISASSPVPGPALHAPLVRLPMSASSVDWFARLYAAVVLLGALRIVRASWAAHALVRHSHPITLPEPLATLWLGYGHNAGVQLPELRESDEVAGPVIIGIRAPVLLVPSGFLRYTEAEVKAALSHELAHVVRHDYAANLLCQVLTLPVVWHPVTHAIERRIGRTREMLCDAMAASRMESSVAYARALLALAQGILERRNGLQAHGLGLLGNNILEERVERLMNVMETKMHRKIEMSVRAKVVRITGAASAMAASMVIAATFHVAPLLAQSTESPATAPTVAQPLAVQAAPAPAPAPQASVPARPEPAPTPAPAPMQGTANPAEPELAAPAEIAPAPFAAPALPNLGDVQIAPSLPGVASLGKGSVVIDDGAATHAHRWTSADGRHYVVLNDQAADPSEDEKQRIEQKAIDARKLAAETAVKIDKDFRLKVQKQVKDDIAYLNRNGSGLGLGNANGVAQASGGNTGGDVYRVGGGVSAPVLLYQPQPELSDEARKTKLTGDVIVSIQVDPTGHPINMHIARGIGMGLDEKALEAVRQYKFKPAMKDGKPVTVEMNIDVNFQSPELKKKMAEARIDEATALARLNALNSPELTAQLARLNSPEFRKELAAAAASQAKALADLNSSQAEMKQSMEDATKRMEEATKRLEAATRALEAAQAQMQKK